jgi:tetratricopeptide (TPR) repeat protein
VTIPLAANVRIAGLVLIAYLLLFTAVRAAIALGRGASARGALTPWLRAAGLACLVAGGAYLLVCVPWPFAHTDPLRVPLLALRHLSRLETFNALDLFEGRWIDSRNAPWYFVPKWFLIGMPLFVPLGLAVGAGLLALRRPGRALRIDGFGLFAVATAALFPILFVIARGSNVYNDSRHVLFAYPPLVVLCAVAFDGLLRRVGEWRSIGAVLSLALAATVAEPLLYMARNHPNEGVYFSPLVGGVAGAWKRYETDFWGNSVRQAVEWIHEHVTPEGRPVRVRSWYGDQTKVAYYVARKPGYEMVVAHTESADWDFQVMQTVACKHMPWLLAEWPLEGTVHEVRADGTPLSAVVANLRSWPYDDLMARMTAFVERHPEPANVYALARTYYRFEQFEESAAASRRTVALDPGHAEAWATLCAAAAHLDRRDEAIDACRRALALDPALDRARETLAWLGG